jgi:adenylate cyclase
LPGLRVIAPGSVFGYRGDDADNRRVARELGVGYVVRGSVQRSGDRVRINARLVDPSDDRALWAERYDRALADVFQIQDEVTAGIAAALQVELGPADRVSLARRSTVSVAAYDHFLRGLDHYGRRSKDDSELAKAELREAIAVDPGFSRAYATLGLTYAREASEGWSDSVMQDLERAAELVAAAAAIDATVPQVHFVQGLVELFRHRHTQALEAAERAIALDPNYADAQALRAWILSYAGRPDEGLGALDKAIRLNPRIPASYWDVLGELHYVQGRYGETVEALERALEANPAHERARIWLAAAYAQVGREEDAAWQVAEVLSLDPAFSLAGMQLAFPFKDPRDLERLFDGLRRAGLPE